MDRDDWRAWYAERGLATIPLRPREKRPLRAGWQHPAPGVWEGAPVDANFGVLCGSVSGGLVVLDFDTRDGLQEASGMRPVELAVHTLVVRTARGWHVYAHEPRARTCSPWRGLDVRAEGAMVVAPPSTHPTGASYEFLDPSAPIAPLACLPFIIDPDVPATTVIRELDWETIDALISGQAAKLRAHWALLKEPTGEFDRSRADFAVSRCLWEAGHAEDEIVAVLLALPGSKARERGEAYARRTVARAARARPS